MRLTKQLDGIVDRRQELEGMLGNPDLANDPAQLMKLNKEYAALAPVVEAYQEYQKLVQSRDEAKEILADSDADADMKELANMELDGLPEQIEAAERELEILLLPKDEDDDRNVLVEIRAGAGGAEAALFAGDVLRMYTRYAERKGWKAELMEISESDLGGYKEAILRIAGENVYSVLKFEAGGHRVQRVPETESQGRIHTSAVTVAVLPEAEEVDVDINPADLRVDTYRASGAGGQHVNTTDSAVRITHVPTGIVTQCQDDRSQHKNRDKAMSMMRAKLLQHEREQADKERADARKSMVGSGDRSERIRTYNFPQSRVTDHRINLTVHNLAEIMDGDLMEVTKNLTEADQAAMLAAMAEEVA